MSYFATFYSYKGGVGRTLALANVAWLLANHTSEPARVLAIDFDLGAPGLSHVFGLSHANTALGVVDYVSEYRERAAIPEISRFIHKTAHQNIDLMPAGMMDAHYQRRLETIDWKTLYSGAFGYELIEKLKADISALTPEYDYVLVDSLTGYSDVGGICVNQLPDLLVLLFRLNQQNLDGIERVYKNATRGASSRSVIPVITPSWPFIEEAATKWINRARAAFKERNVLEISFDSSLSFGERIICEEASKLPFNSKLIADYRDLAQQIRKRNPLDCLTIWNTIQAGLNQPAMDQSDLYLTLLKRRPNVAEYWRQLEAVSVRHPQKIRDSEPWKNLILFTNAQAERKNKFALLARARLNRNSPAKAAVDLNEALRIDPSFLEALVERGSIAFLREEYSKAAEDFSTCLSLKQGGPEYLISRVRVKLAETYLRMLDGQQTLLTLASAVEQTSSDADLYQIRARALYLEGKYSEALADAQRFAKMRYAGEPSALLPSQILAAMGRFDEARKELEAFTGENDGRANANVAEAYLAVDPQKTIDLLSKIKRGVDPVVRRLLTNLASLFLGQKIDPRSGGRSNRHAQNWSFFEIVALLRAKERAGLLDQDTLNSAYERLKNASNDVGREFIEKSRQSVFACSAKVARNP